MIQFSAVSSSISGNTFDGPPPSRGGGRGAFGPHNGDFRRNSGSDFLGPINCNDENIENSGGGGRLSQSFEDVRPGFSPRGGGGGGGFRGRGGSGPDRGRGGFDRSFSSPEKGFWGDRG